MTPAVHGEDAGVSLRPDALLDVGDDLHLGAARRQELPDRLEGLLGLLSSATNVIDLEVRLHGARLPDRLGKRHS